MKKAFTLNRAYRGKLGISSGIAFPDIEKGDIQAIENYLQPETFLEKDLLRNADFQKGLFWGIPRWGHPEGHVIYHIREVLNNIDKLDISPDCRRKLRLVAFVHDTFKYAEHRGNPRDWTRHHAVLARNFMEEYIAEKQLLDIIEFHDEAYYIWIEFHVKKNVVKGKERMAKFLERFSDSLQFYYYFFKCDTETGDKTLEPVKWFEKTFEGIKVVKF